MAGKIRKFFKLSAETPDTLIKITWGIFILTSPFIAMTLYHQPVISWIWVGTMGLWGFTFSNAYLHRMYWRNHDLMIQNQQEMLNQIEVAYHMLHEHCPNCGQRLRSPSEVRQ